MMSNLAQPVWWGRFNLDQGQTAQWEIGPLKLALQHLPNEWQIAYERAEEIDPETAQWQNNPVAPDLSELKYAHTERYVTGQTSEVLRLTPFLADRSIITRPLTPLYVPAQAKAIIYVSSPLWIGLEVGQPPVKLQEVPISRPSDTWFGPSTMEGELCYASRTCARLNLKNLPLRMHRAITQIIIDNKAGSQLLVERLSLPVPYLSIFETSDGMLWTEAVTMIRTRDTGMAAFQIEEDPPKQAKDPQRVSDPRRPPEQRMMVRAFGALVQLVS